MPKLSTFKDFFFFFENKGNSKKWKCETCSHRISRARQGETNTWKKKQKTKTLKGPTRAIHGSGWGCPFFTGPKTSYPYPYFYFMFGHFQFSRSTKETPTNTVEDKTSQIYGWIGIAFVGLKNKKLKREKAIINDLACFFHHGTLHCIAYSRKTMSCAGQCVILNPVSPSGFHSLINQSNKKPTT